MCSMTWTRSFCCNARSPASVGVYEYNAAATDNIEGPVGYAGGGRGAGVGIGE